MSVQVFVEQIWAAKTALRASTQRDLTGVLARQAGSVFIVHKEPMVATVGPTSKFVDMEFALANPAKEGASFAFANK